MFQRLAIVILIGAKLLAAPPASVVRNGSFESLLPNGQPTDWRFDDNPNLQVVEEGGNRFLRVSRHPSWKGLPWTHQTIPVDPSWKRARVSVRMRVRGLVVGEKSWQDARISMRCEAEDGKLTGYAPTPQRNTDCDWTEVTAEGEIPKGTARIMMEPALFGKKGVVDFDDIRLVPIIPPDPKALKPVPAPPEVALWGEEPVEELSRTRARIWLNGVWRFMPAIGPAEKAPVGGAWGYIPVPGAWVDDTWRVTMPGPVAVPVGGPWYGVELKELDRAWYERELRVPESWQGRAVLLNVHRLCTDAVVFVDGKKAGQINWPDGVLDITAYVKPGGTVVLRLLVLATPDEGEVFRFMGTATSQVSSHKATLQGRGLTGEVSLECQPRGAHVSDVFVKPSTRRQRVDLEVELRGVRTAGQVRIEADMRDEKGRSEKRFSAVVQVEARERQVIRTGWEWASARRWDFGEPNLYTVHLTVQNGGELDDTYAQRFGFREFWIEGKDFHLNGRRVRLRPIGGHGGKDWGIPEVMDRRMGVLMGMGFNIAELWPNDHGERGFMHARDLVCERADEEGFGLTGVALALNKYLYSRGGGLKWDDPAVRAEWAARMQEELRQYRNHPSVLMWGSSANFFGTADDQDPRIIGTHGFQRDQHSEARAKAGREGIELIKAFDPTRPVFTHHGSDVGDVHTVNMYLNVLPLQDRMEWLSRYAGQGSIPLLPVEFGTPLHPTFHRGRAGYGKAMSSEPLLAEFCAIHFGNEAFADESREYREVIRQGFLGEQRYRSYHGNSQIEEAEVFQRFQVLFSSHTWRAWRTWGIAGGMIPWADGHGWPAQPRTTATVSVGPFRPGHRGAYFAEIPEEIAHPYQPPASPVLPAGEAILANSQSTLAYIAGHDSSSPRNGFTDRTHHYRPGTKVAKQVALINDTTVEQPYSFVVSLRVGGEAVDQVARHGQVDVAASLLVPVQLDVPAGLANRTDAEIVLEARIGESTHNDRFSIRFYAAPPAASREVCLLDPVGETRTMLHELGYKTQEWKKGTKPEFLVVGRRALSSGQVTMDLVAEQLADGGRVLVMGQDPEWLRNALQLRVAQPLSRHAFPVGTSEFGHDLDADDLANWAGHSRLLEPYPDYSATGVVRGTNGIPRWGWRWGARHALCSAPVEKPHLAGWRPLLECEFGLMYSPLLELDCNSGRLTLCTLDLEDHAVDDPAAGQLLGRLLTHVATAPLVPRATLISYLGDDAGAALLSGLRLRYRRVSDMPDGGLLVLGPGAPAGDEQLLRFAEKGGRVLVLARAQEEGPLGVTRETVDDIAVLPNPEACTEFAGLSPSCLRVRAPRRFVVLKGGAGGTVSADGLLCRRTVGKGVVVFTQLDPVALDADRKTYYRYTRWGWTRSLAQVLANLGAEFAGDEIVFQRGPRPVGFVPLSGEWQARLTVPIRNAGDATHPDPGCSAEAAAFLRKPKTTDGFRSLSVPGLWEEQATEWDNTNGEMLCVKRFDLPANLRGRDMVLRLGCVDDRDETWLNGVRLGGTAPAVASAWNVEREYSVPARVLRPTGNVLVVRIWDQYREGGFRGTQEAIRLEPAVPVDLPTLYHADYRDDFEFGDDPYRYYRW